MKKNLVLIYSGSMKMNCRLLHVAQAVSWRETDIH